MMEMLGIYVLAGVLVFVLLAYGIDCERPPANWWRDRSFLMATVVMVLLWPWIVYLWLRKMLR